MPNVSNYYWRVPGNGGLDEKDHMRIRIVDVSDVDNAIYDASDADFQVRWRFRMISPNGGETWYTGLTNPVVWATPPGLGGQAQLYVSPDSGTNWTELTLAANNVGVTNNIYPWAIPKDNPALLSERARMAVSIQGATLGFDASDADFTIAGIRIIRPLPGQPWRRGITTNITWISSGAGPGGVTLELSLDGGATYPVLITNNAPNVTGTNTFAWTIAAPNPSSTARLRATGNVRPQVWGESAVFKLSDVDIKDPALGVSWQVGTTNTIRWTTGGAGTMVNLYYSANDGATWTPVVGGTEVANIDTTVTNTFEWVIPSAPTTVGRIKIADVDSGESLWAQSARFNIAGVRIDRPNGGITEPKWTLGKTERIYWTFAAAGPSQAGLLQFSYGGNTDYRDISLATYPLAATNFPYVPTNPTVQARAKIIAMDPLVTNMWDISDNYFTVAGIKVQRPGSNDVYTVDTLVNQGIRWVSAGTGDDGADAFYSANNGGTWTPLFNSVYNDEGFPGVNNQNWSPAMTVDLNPSENARIRVVAGSVAVSGIYTGLSDRFIARGIKVTKPAAGEVVSLGALQRVNWLEAGIGSDARAPFYLSVDGGATFNTNASILGFAAPVGITTTANWMVSAALDPTTSAVIRVVVTNSNVGADIGYAVNSKPFVLRGMRVISPTAGMNWEIGTPQSVQFLSAAAGAYADILYAADGVNFDAVTPVADDIAIGNGLNTFVWTIERTRQPSTNARLRVTSGGLTADSPVFTVGGVMVTRPTGSDIWAVGETNRIQWISVGTQGTNTIQIRRGATVVGGITNVTGAFYYWTVASNAAGTNITIRVTDSGGYYGVSEPFEIVSEPIIRILSPLPGEFFRVSETYDVRWSRGGNMGGDFAVFLSTNNFVTRSPVFGGTPDLANNIFSFPWTLNDPDRLGAARLFVTNMITPGIQDTSGVFYLSPKFEITMPNGGETLYALRPTTVKWKTQGTIPAVDLYYTVDPLRSPASWVKANTTPIPAQLPYHNVESSYTWSVPQVPHGSLMWIRVQDPRYTNRFDRNLRGPFDDCDNVVTVNWYRIVWDMYNQDTGQGLDKLSVSDSSGWSAANLPSNVVHYYPYGTYDTVWYREFFHDQVIFQWLADSSRTNRVPMKMSEIEPEYHVMANFAYAISNRTFTINSWLERNGAILKNPDRCVIDVYWKGGDQIESLTKLTPDLNGVFWQDWVVGDTEAALRADGRLGPTETFNSTDVFFAKVLVRFSGVEYSAGLTFALRLAAAEEQVDAIGALISGSEGRVIGAIGGVSNAVSGVSNAVADVRTSLGVFRGETGTNFARLMDLGSATTSMLARVETGMQGITNTILPGIDLLTNMVSVMGPTLSNVWTSVTNLESTADSGLARILTRPTTVPFGSVNAMLFKTRAGWDSSQVLITVSNAAQGQVFSSTMSEVIGGIYQRDLTADWGTNSYIVTCRDPKASDQMILTVSGSGSLDDMPDQLAGVSNRIADLQAQLDTVEDLVAGMEGLDLSGVMTGLDEVQTAVAGLGGTDLTEVMTGLESVQDAVAGLGGTDLSQIDLSGVTRIEERLGRMNDPVDNDTFFGRLAWLATRIEASGQSASDASKKAQSAKTEAAAAASGVEELKLLLAAGDPGATLRQLGVIRESLSQAQRDVQDIPRQMRISELYSSMKEMATVIDQLARSRGFDPQMNLVEPAAGAEGEAEADEDMIGVLNRNLGEIKGSMQFMQQLINDMRYEPTITETLVGTE